MDFDAIGVQFHKFVTREKEEEYALNRYNPMRIFDVLDTFSDFKKPIHLSEITISAYSNSDEDWQFKHKLLKICTKFGLVKKC